MARTTTGGLEPVGGRRRPCRRLLPAILVLAALVTTPLPAAALSNAEAWMAARLVHHSHSTAIVAAASELVEGGSMEEIRDLRVRIASAVIALDRLEVHACFQEWWSYVRSSYVLLDQALVGLERNDYAHVQSAATASRYLSALATNVHVECPWDEDAALAGPRLGSGDPLPLAGAMDPLAG